MAVNKDRVMQKVQQLMRKDQWKKALDEMKNLHAEAKTDPMVSLRLGDLYLKNNDPRAAADSYYTTAELFNSRGYTAKAIATYKMILRIDPANKEVEGRIDRLVSEKQPAPKPRERHEAPPPGPAPLVPARPGTPEQTAPEPIELSAAPCAPGEVVYDTYGEFGESAHVEPAGTPAPLSFGDIELSKPSHGFELESEREPVEMQPVPPAPADAGQAPSPAQIPLFSHIPKDELWDMLGRMGRMSFAADEVIVREGESGDSLFIIRSGAVKVVTSVKGAEVTLAELGERDFFGEVSYLTGRPRTADIVAVQPTEVIEIPRAELEKLIARHPDIEGELREFYENRVNDTLASLKAVSRDVLR